MNTGTVVTQTVNPFEAAYEAVNGGLADEVKHINFEAAYEAVNWSRAFWPGVVNFEAAYEAVNSSISR